ncbi:hypothetical protein DSM106044_04301 [Robinsoniella peoriensis]|uniref:Uncharacterized protein n=1 Tax=Robinsoniella peoriensis TaxID=180332 RepID=A0A4U8Q2K8_9FIRM|nr:hypothetical protein DSM106044_04301 [Robinsoniella peoriensis]
MGHAITRFIHPVCERVAFCCLNRCFGWLTHPGLSHIAIAVCRRNFTFQIFSYILIQKDHSTCTDSFYGYIFTVNCIGCIPLIFCISFRITVRIIKFIIHLKHSFYMGFISQFCGKVDYTTCYCLWNLIIPRRSYGQLFGQHIILVSNTYGKYLISLCMIF